MQDVWIVGRNLAETEEGIVWSVIGVFDDFLKAVDACYDEDCFVGPMEMNVRLSKETYAWKGCIYPHIELDTGENNG